MELTAKFDDLLLVYWACLLFLTFKLKEHNSKEKITKQVLIFYQGSEHEKKAIRNIDLADNNR